jgi:peptidoglycan/LPS O-acetylase OafA/YrhL
MVTRSGHFPLIDSIRGIALLSVVAAHSSFFMGLSGSNSLSEVRFDFAVRVFFIISAFLLYRPYVRARLRAEERPRFRAYGWRRLLRIVPPYWTALTLIAIWLGLSYVFTAEGVPIYYGLAQVYFPEYALGGLTQAWSLCVEIVFYALLPLIVVLMRRLRARDERQIVRQELAMAALLFALSLAYKAWLVSAGAIGDLDLLVLQLNTMAFLDDFALGMALATISAVYEGREHDSAALRAVDRFPGVPWLVAIAVTIVVSTQLGLSGQLGDPLERGQYLPRHYLLGLVAVALLLPALYGQARRGLVRRILASRVLLFLGLLSYSVYLWHFAVLEQLARWDFAEVAQSTTSWIWFPVALAASVAIASVSYYLVERPALKLKRLVPYGPPEPPPQEAIAEPAPASPARPQAG